MFSFKKDGTLPLCVDYGKENAVAVRDLYPVPRMNACIHSLVDAQVFSTLGGNCGCWQIEVDRADRENAAFSSHHGSYELARKSFGLKNAPSTFLRVMNIIISKV